MKQTIYILGLFLGILIKTTSLEAQTVPSAMNVFIEEVDFKTGDEFWVHYASEDLLSLILFQGSTQHDLSKLQFMQEISYHLPNMNGNNFHSLTTSQEGVINYSWSILSNEDMPTTPKMFSLKFKALSDGKLSESLSFKDTWTTNISYDFVVLDAEIPVIYHFATTSTFNGLKLKGTTSVKENNVPKTISLFPNPSQIGEPISFEWDTNEQLNLEISNIDGKIIGTKKMLTEVGINTISMTELSNQNLTPGLYFVQFQGEKSTKISKLLVN